MITGEEDKTRFSRRSGELVSTQPGEHDQDAIQLASLGTIMWFEADCTSRKARNRSSLSTSLGPLRPPINDACAYSLLATIVIS